MSPSPPWSPTREPQGRYEELAPMDEYGLMPPGASTGDLSDAASDDDAVHHDDHGVSGWAQTPAWNICLNAAMYCAVPLSMPATLAAGGWFWGTVFFTYCTCATYWTGLIIGRVYLEHRGRLATYPAMAAEAFASLALNRTGNARIANDVRIHARRCVEVIQFATFYLDTVTQIVYVAQYFGQLDRGWVSGSRRVSGRASGRGCWWCGQCPRPSCRYHPSTRRGGSSSRPSQCSDSPCCSSYGKSEWKSARGSANRGRASAESPRDQVSLFLHVGN